MLPLPSFRFVLLCLAMPIVLVACAPEEDQRTVNLTTFDGDKIQWPSNSTEQRARSVFFTTVFLKLKLLKLKILSKLLLAGHFLPKLVGKLHQVHIGSTTPQHVVPTTSEPVPTTTEAEVENNATTTMETLMTTDIVHPTSTDPSTNPPNNATPVTCYNRNDMLIAVDESYSVTDTFMTELSFAGELAAAWRSYPENRVGVLFFNHNSRKLIGLKESEVLNSTAIRDVIVQARQMKGYTAIHEAINLATQEFQQNGRQNVSKNLIVLTDGLSNLGLVQMAASRYYAVEKTRGFAVGVGSGADSTLLGAIAGGNFSRVFALPDFTHLLGTLRQLSVTVCSE